MTRAKDPSPATTQDLPTDQQVALKLFVILARAFSAINEHATADAREDGLSLGEFAVLELLYHRGQTLLGDIQRRILVSSGGITFLVDRLVDKGLVERRECEGDRRARYAALTREGQRLMKRSFPRHAARLARAVAGLSLTDQREATRLLKQLGLAATAPAPLPD